MPLTLTDKQYMDRLLSVILLRQQGYYEQAETIARDLMIRRPEESSLHHQLGQIATAIGYADVAVEEFGYALRLMREHGTLATHALQFQATALGYAQSLMRLGRFEEAWPYWESGRLHVSWSPWPTTEYWDGTAENIPSLLVQAEGGYGDIFMFMRWIGLLKSVKGVGRVGLMIFPGLADFCDWSALGVDEVYKVDVDKIPFGRWAYSCSIMSLPACFNVKSWDDIPTAKRYPKDEGLLPVWDRVPGDDGPYGSLKIGFCWRAEENSSPIRTKSLDVDTATDIVSLIRERYEGYEDLIVCSLSPEKKDLYNTEPFAQPAGLVYEPGCMDSWRDTASYLCSMDLVLTVDTAVLHLCGLLGVPALGLIPKGGCWRFSTHDKLEGPWYGPHLRYYRQPEVLKWDASDIVEKLMAVINAT
jgi:hypothetical protein